VHPKLSHVCRVCLHLLNQWLSIGIEEIHEHLRNSILFIEQAGNTGIEWHLIPIEGQQINRQAEEMIGILKKQMLRSLETRRYSHEEICISLQETAQIVNCRTLAGGVGSDLNPLTLADLLMG
jgi:hypothetical protein